MSFLPHFQKLPPFMVAAIAKGRKNNPLTSQQIAAKSGIPLRTVERLCGLVRWHGVKAETIDRFESACGVDLISQSRVKHYLRCTATLAKTPLPNLTSTQRKVMNALMMEWRNEKGQR